MSALIVASTSRVIAQPAEPKTEAETPTPNRTITVVGEVNKPGIYPFVEGESLETLLGRAGGATSSASMQNASLLREGIRIPLNFLSPEEVVAKLILHEGDVLFVPAAKRRIFVAGNVAKPGFFPLPETGEISVVDAIVLAGGILSNPKDVKIGVLRGKSESTVEWHDWPEKVGEGIFRRSIQDGDGIYVKRTTSYSPPTESGLQLIENQQQ